MPEEPSGVVWTGTTNGVALGGRLGASSKKPGARSVSLYIRASPGNDGRSVVFYPDSANAAVVDVEKQDGAHIRFTKAAKGRKLVGSMALRDVRLNRRDRPVGVISLLPGEWGFLGEIQLDSDSLTKKGIAEAKVSVRLYVLGEADRLDLCELPELTLLQRTSP